jgi:predicted phosphate transport protein (TIGR00153 family)
MALTRDKVFWNAFIAHAAETVKASRLLYEMLEKPADAERLAREIAEIEQRGDTITHDTITALHQTWITPLDREEIHQLISRLDDVLDYVEAAAERIALYEIKEATPEALELGRVLTAVADDMVRAVTALQSMKDPKPLLDLCVAINDHENQADRILRRGLARLFKGNGNGNGGAAYREGPGLDPIEVMKWRDIYESLETATDRAEDVANIIEGIVLEHG